MFSLVLIALDQAVKLLVHFYMEPGFPGQIKVVGEWFKLHYVLNPGMAFGMQLGHEYGKLLLSVFRLVAMAGIGWYLVYLAQRGAPDGLLWAMAMILAGAVGNVIDSTFYGVLLGNAPYGSPTPWFHGQVIDMIFIDVWEGFIPDWVPLWGGQYYSTPIFNIADSCIFIGVCMILFFQRRFFGEHTDEEGLLPQGEPHPEEVAIVPAAELDDTYEHHDIHPIESPDTTDTEQVGKVVNETESFPEEPAHPEPLLPGPEVPAEPRKDKEI